MNTAARRTIIVVLSCSIGLLVTGLVRGADESGWVDLIGEHGLDAWRKPTGDWIVGADSTAQSGNPKLLDAKPGRGTLVNGKTGKTRNLLTVEKFGDLEAHFEFLVPKGSNSGVKFEGFYEIQIYDSFGVAKPNATHAGGIYPRAEMLPRYHHIDEGIAPRSNACLAPGVPSTTFSERASSLILSSQSSHTPSSGGNEPLPPRSIELGAVRFQ